VEVVGAVVVEVAVVAVGAVVTVVMVVVGVVVGVVVAVAEVGVEVAEVVMLGAVGVFCSFLPLFTSRQAKRNVNVTISRIKNIPQIAKI
jgi:hypothetical protein